MRSASHTPSLVPEVHWFSNASEVRSKGYGRLVKVITSSLSGRVEEAFYVVGVEDRDEAIRLVEKEVAIGSKVEVMGRMSHQLMSAVGLNPYKVTRV
jgi:hypothetical protein